MKIQHVLLGVIVLATSAFAGDLNPPAGPIAPTPGPEPRTAINPVNTPGDANSVFRISSPGSYYLTGSVTGVAAKNGIKIEASNVTLDLMGFELVGVAGSLDGLLVSGLQTGLSVHNGSAHSWGTDGIDMINASGSTIFQVRSIGNSGIGIRVGSACIVRECQALSNSSSGIVTGNRSAITRCTAQGNGAGGGGNGITTSNDCTISECVACSNGSGPSGGSGINAGSSNTIIGCAASANGTGADFSNDGIVTSSGTLVANCTTASNSGDGIQVQQRCIVIGNISIGNGFLFGTGAAIHATGSDNRIEGNNCIISVRGIDVDAAGNIIIRNTCSGNTTNWDIVANNVCGPILDRRSPGSAAILGDSAPSSLGTTDANANFTY